MRMDLAMAKTATRRNTTRRKATTRSATRRKAAHSRKHTRGTDKRDWWGRVSRESDALDLEGGVFSLKDPKQIAASLKRSAERSSRRKAEPYRSTLSMLVFYINRAGKNLPANRKRILERAKGELKKLFGRDSRGHDAAAPRGSARASR